MILRAERAVAEWECAKLIYEFARLNDAEEYEKLSLLFREDGIFIRPSAPKDAIVGRDAIRRHFQDRPKRFTCHFITNVIVELDRPDLARATSQALIYIGDKPPLPEKTIRGADCVQRITVFNDVLVLERKQWHFASRKGLLALSIN